MAHIKPYVALLLIGIQQIYSLEVADLYKYENKDCSAYVCLEEDDNVVVIDDKIETCPLGYKCNKVTDPCVPCVPRTICTSNYFCPIDKDKTKIIVNGNLLFCPKFYECNTNVQRDGKLCVQEKCLEAAFKCNENDLTTFEMFGLTLPCPANWKCNNKYVAPCGPCHPVVEELPDEPESIPKPEPTPKPTPPGPSEPTPKPTPPGPSEPTPTPSCPTAPSTPPNVTPEYIPHDCNDGYGGTRPCRAAGTPGSIFYYKCVKQNKNKYKLYSEYCSNKRIDKVCSNDETICL